MTVTRIPPMRAQAVTLAAADPYLTEDWSAELKIDGCRAAVTVDRAGSRLANDRTGDRTHVAPGLAAVEGGHVTVDGVTLDDVVLDGEFHAPAGDDEALPPFARSAGWFNCGRTRAVMLTAAYGPARFAAFDVLRVRGQDWTRRPYTERRAMLEKITAAILARYPDCGLWLVPRLPATREVIDAVLAAGFEGVVLKRNDSIYAPGDRPSWWVKIKAKATIDVVLTGAWREGSQAGTVGSVEIAVTTTAGTLTGVGHCAVKPKQAREVTPATVAGMAGQVWEVDANGASGKPGDVGKLRHPRYLRARPDKTADQCGAAQLDALPRTGGAPQPAQGATEPAPVPTGHPGRRRPAGVKPVLTQDRPAVTA